MSKIAKDKTNYIDFSTPIVMGILNITTDSFYDGGKFLTEDNIINQAQKIENEGAKIILISHMGRPNGKFDSNLSLMPAGEKLADLLEMPIKFSDNCISEDAHDVTLGLRSGEVHLLENLRFHIEETNNDQNFSINLAKHGQVFINDAFGTAHRSHASNLGVSKYFNQKGMGFLIDKENVTKSLYEKIKYLNLK